MSTATMQKPEASHYRDGILGEPTAFRPTQLEVDCYLTGTLDFAEFHRRQVADFVVRYGKQNAMAECQRRSAALICYLTHLESMGLFDAVRH